MIYQMKDLNFQTILAPLELSNVEDIKKVATVTYRSWVTLDCFSDLNINDIEYLIKAFISANKNRYQQLLKPLNVEYSIIDNYDMKETLTRNNETNSTYNKGQESSTNKMKTVDSVIDSRSIENNTTLTATQNTNINENKSDNGSNTTNNTIKGKVVTGIVKNPTESVNTKSAVPYDTNDFKNTERDINRVTEGEQTTTNNEDTANNTITTTSSSGTTENITKYSGKDITNTTGTDRNEKTGNQSVDNTITNSNRTDSNTQNVTETYTLKRSGNIGTMTSTDVMDKHVKFWTDFVGYSIILKDIVDNFFILRG